MEHVKGIVALKGLCHDDVALTLTSTDLEHQFREVTKIWTDSKPGVLHAMLTTLQGQRTEPLLKLRAFSSLDSEMTLNIFTYGSKQDEKMTATAEDGAHILAKVESPEEREALTQYFSCCHPAYVKYTTPERFLVHRNLYEKVQGMDKIEVRFDKGSEDKVWITLAANNALAEPLLSKITKLLCVRGVNIEQLFMDKIADPSNCIGDQPGAVCMVRIQSTAKTDSKDDFSALHLEGKGWLDLKYSLCRIRWLDAAAVELALNRQPAFRMDQAEVITAFCAMLHGPLSKISKVYTRSYLLEMCGNPKYSTMILDVANLFIARFDPSISSSWQEKSGELRKAFANFGDEEVRVVLLKMLDAVELTLRTNLFVPGRCALSLRIDPALMISGDQEKPFGVFFIHGQGYDGFHNRFHNIARGGLRLVSPQTAEQHAIESSRVYDEVYNLSYAQQLKNKDIPEGGAKAVVLVDLSKSNASMRYQSLRNAAKGFVDALLDLIVPVEQIRKQCVDYLGFDEIIYLGPDEQILPEDINWMIAHAAKRGYGLPSAFMSSKPLAGINHKTYGVTSAGVAVFLDVALRNNGINPKESPFTLKITGGPDGDVGGNLLRILFRDYGSNVKVVGIADGSGCAEDPEGISHDELLRLFQAGAPIGELDRSSLSEEGALHLADTEHGARMRNTMHNRVKSDVFVPAGGRPNTVHIGNWKDFLDPATGAPSSPLIVEGANIFLTPDARKALHEHAKVTIVKDSSANKCGVITSSYEICSSMLLEEKEFLEIKEELVQDVLVRLRELARLEAELLFREYNNYPGALPAFSERISQAISRTKLAIWKDLEHMKRGDSTYEELLPLFVEEHLPKNLASVAGDRVSARIPLDYLRNAFASSLASKLLYKEGIHFLESQPRERLTDLAMRYYKEEKRIQELLAVVKGAESFEEATRAEVMQLLERGGVRSALQVY
jgi:glutamate dehydrogenase